jgi:DNA-binding GntR family transcriptional regulator
MTNAVPVGAVENFSVKSLHEEVLMQLRKALLEGDLPPGARVPERELCDRFGISRTPLREALKVLAAEGLVELLPNRGSRIKSLTEKDILELFEFVGGLEAMAGRLACARITDEEIHAVEALHYDMYAHYMRRDRFEYFRLNQLIHEAILHAARNDMLSAAHANYSGRIRRLRYTANMQSERDRWGEAMREHELILDALQRRSGPELSEILVRHLDNKCSAAIEHSRAQASAT